MAILGVLSWASGAYADSGSPPPVRDEPPNVTPPPGGDESRASDPSGVTARSTNEGKEPPKLDPESAEERVRAAKLTPIVASPHDASKTAFQLYWEVDIPVLAISAILASARLLRAVAPTCARVDGHCDPAELNAFDRHFAGTWEPGWRTYSDVGLISLSVGAATVLLVDEGAMPALNDLVVVAEAGFVATALPSMTTLATSRPRPYTYGNKAPLADRTSGDAALSFISSHTSISFAVATSMFIATKRLHPHSALPWIVLGVGLGAASSVAVARVLAGQHFPTDILAGATIGASVGTVVASVHRLPIEVTPTSGGALLSFGGTF
jgi:membrane-associated phospholipid phosphatase